MLDCKVHRCAEESQALRGPGAGRRCSHPPASTYLHVPCAITLTSQQGALSSPCGPSEDTEAGQGQVMSQGHGEHAEECGIPEPRT